MKASEASKRLSDMVEKGCDFDVKSAFKDTETGVYVYFDIGNIIVFYDTHEIILFAREND